MDECMPSMMHGLRKVKYVSDTACTPLRLNVYYVCLRVDYIYIYYLCKQVMHHYSARASKRATAARSSTACTTGSPLLPRRPSKIRSHARRRKATKVARSRMMPVHMRAQGTWAVYTWTEVLHLSADMHTHMHMETRHVGAACHTPQRAPKSMSKNMAAAAARMSCTYTCTCTCTCTCPCCICACACHVHVCVCVSESVGPPTPTASMGIG